VQNIAKKGIRIYLSLLIYIAFSTILNAQIDSLHVDKKVTVLGVNLDYGFLIKHTPTLEEIPDAYPSGISVSWSKFILTKNAWEFCNCFPRFGVDLGYWNWDNPDVLGHGILSMGFVEPYFMTQNRLNLFVRTGFGGAYNTNPYDEIPMLPTISYLLVLSTSKLVF
jgi:hypothetical protein